MNAPLSLLRRTCLLIAGACLLLENSQAEPVAPAISAGESHSLFLKSDGTVWATGNNNGSRFGDGTGISRRSPGFALHGVRAVSAGGSHSLFLKTDGTAWTAGDSWVTAPRPTAAIPCGR